MNYLFFILPLMVLTGVYMLLVVGGIVGDKKIINHGARVFGALLIFLPVTYFVLSSPKPI